MPLVQQPSSAVSAELVLLVPYVCGAALHSRLTAEVSSVHAVTLEVQVHWTLGEGV